jgi:vesicle coat complex subunit
MERDSPNARLSSIRYESRKEMVVNGSSAPSKKTVYLAMLSVIAIAILASCAAMQMQEGTSTCKHSPAFEAVEKMRGFSMQLRPGFRKPDPDSIRRDQIMAEFRRIGKEAIPAIARALKDPDAQMRRNAALVLIELAGDWTGKPTVDIRAAIPSLISATEDPDHHVRAWAAHALVELGPDAKEAVPVLTNMLKDPAAGPRHNSAMALGQIGAAAKTALPALREALKDPEADVQRMSKVAIALIEKACGRDDQAIE